MILPRLRTDRPARFVFPIDRGLDGPFVLRKVRLGKGKGEVTFLFQVHQINGEGTEFAQHEITMLGEPGSLGWQLWIGQSLDPKASQRFSSGVRGKAQKEGGLVGSQLLHE